MSYTTEVLVSGATKFAGNAVRLATRECRVVESEDPVNYAFVPSNGLTPVAEEKAG